MTIAIAGDALVGYLLASARILAWLLVVPPFSSKALPGTAKVVLAVGLAVAVAPASKVAVPSDAVGLAVVAGEQVLVGGMLGFVTYLVFAAVSAAGSLVDVFGGFSLAQAFDPMSVNQNSVFGTFHQFLATALLFTTKTHLLVVGGLLETFRVLPVGQMPSMPHDASILTTGMTLMFLSAVQIALPMVAVLVLADLGLALMTKVAPQLNAMNVMFPAKIGLVLLILGMSFPVLPGVVSRLGELATQAMAAVVGAG